MNADQQPPSSAPSASSGQARGQARWDGQRGWVFERYGPYRVVEKRLYGIDHERVHATRAAAVQEAREYLMRRIGVLQAALARLACHPERQPRDAGGGAGQGDSDV